MKNLKNSVFSVCTLALLSTACLKVENPIGSSSKKKNKVSSSTQVDTVLGEDENKVRVVSEDMLSSNNFISADSPLGQKLLASSPMIIENIAPLNGGMNLGARNSLKVGIPLSLIGQQSVFGGVFTKVSDKANETLGTLKLTDLPPIHVTTTIAEDSSAPAGGQRYYLALVGCASECTERSEQQPLIYIPIHKNKIDMVNKMAMLDLESVSAQLDLISMMDPNGDYTKLKAEKVETIAVDYEDLTTLVFDIKTTMVAVDADPQDPEVARTEITTRWYLKLGSAFNPGFEARTPTEGVGFFTTTRNKATKITRFDLSKNVHYFIKNVPERYRPHFAKAFDNWNANFKNITGGELLTYEFVEKTDPRHSEIVPGDVRYNVVEWDLDNKASYGGLGPSIANQHTGETLAAHILIQGPTIVDLYTKWFGVSEEARDLQAQGLLAEADALMADFNKEASDLLAKRSKAKFKVKLGKHLDLVVRAQQGELEDPIVKGHFDMVPEGVTYDEYMEGYFMEMLEHEMGHNLGLRHNFKGNLGAVDESKDKGFVSRSIMEYLGRPYRHKNMIGSYDKMAIAYGYTGVAPAHKNWFCTDEDQAMDATTLTTASPECTKSDATSDPFSFWENRLDRALDLLLGHGSEEAPAWTAKELESQIDEIAMAFNNYGFSAVKTADTWTNFFGKGDRPEKKEDVKAYVLTKLKAKICDPSIAALISAKATPEASASAEKNYTELTKRIADKSKTLLGYKAQDLKCN